MIELADYLKKLQGEDEADRIYAAEDIGYANAAGGIRPLLARLPAEPSRAVREAIFSALAQIDHDDVIEGAIGLLDSPDPFLRNQTVELLRARGTKAIPYLDAAFRTGDVDRRKFVIDVLAKLRDSEASTSYDLALEDVDINVVITAVESLGDTGKIAYRGRIESLIDRTAHPMLLCACMTSLAQIGDASSCALVRARVGPASGLAGYLLPSYMKLLGAQGLPEDAAEAADFVERDSLVASVLNTLTALRNRYRHLSLPPEIAVPLQRIVERAEMAPLPYQSVRLLGLLVDQPGVFQFLEKCLQSTDKSVRIGAGQALKDVASEAAEEVLRLHLATEKDSEVLHAWSGSEAP